MGRPPSDGPSGRYGSENRAPSPQLARRPEPDGDTLLILADAQAPAALVLAIVEALGERGGRLGVRGSLSAATALAKDLRRQSDKAELRVQLDHDTVSIEGPQHGGTYDWAKLATVFAPGSFGDGSRLAVAANPSATAQDLARLHELVIGAGVGAVGPLTVGSAPSKDNGEYGLGLEGFGEGSDPDRIGLGISGDLHSGPHRPPNQKPRVPVVRLGTLVVTGDLDKNIIRRYLRRKSSSFTFCYEKQLLVNPQLQGTVTATFEIDPNGSAKATAAGVNTEVAECIATVIESILFPSGTSVVSVKLPLQCLHP